MNYSPRNCHPINLKESLTIPVSRHRDFIWHFYAYLNDIAQTAGSQVCNYYICISYVCF